MYQSFFGLDKNPFSITPDPAFLHLTAAHREALAGLLFAISCRKGFVVLTGEAGTGKTTLIRTTLKRVSSSRTVSSFLVHPTLSPSEFLEYTLLDFGLTDIPASKAQRLRLFHEFLVRCCAEGKTPVLVIDEAQKLSPELLEEIRLLTNAETAEQKLLQIVLAGQNELSALLDRDDMRQLRQRISVRLTIGPLPEADVREYMRTRWLRAGGSKAFPFTEEAVSAVARSSRGVPRMINVISDAALLAAFAAESQSIEASHIANVVRDLQLPHISAMTSVTQVSKPGLSPKPVIPAPVQPATATDLSNMDVPVFATLDRYMPSEERKPGIMRWAARLGFGKA